MSSFRTILVPVDFSPHAAKALEIAIDLAVELGAKLHLLHCYQVNVGSISPYGIVLPEGLDRDVRDAAASAVAEWREKAEAAGVEVADSVSPVFPSEAISATAEDIGADLIVMGTRGLTGLRHVVLGSVAERTARIAPCPVMMVKGDDED